MATTIGSQAIKILCQNQDTAGLSEQQKQALHACKFAIIAAIENLYVTLHHSKADPILEKFIKIPPE